MIISFAKTIGVVSDEDAASSGVDQVIGLKQLAANRVKCANFCIIPCGS